MKTGFPIQSALPLHRSAEEMAAERESQLREVSKLYERQFIQEMVNAMRKTVQHSELTEPTMAEKIYQDDLFNKYVDQWSDRGDLGLAEKIYQQVKNQVAVANAEAPKSKGPIALEKPAAIHLPTQMELELRQLRKPDEP